MKQSKVAKITRPVYFAPPLTGYTLELGIGSRNQENQNDGANGGSKKFYDWFNRLDTIPACDRRTDGRTPHDGKDRAMQSVARVVIQHQSLPLCQLRVKRYMQLWMGRALKGRKRAEKCLPPYAFTVEIGPIRKSSPKWPIMCC